MAPIQLNRITPQSLQAIQVSTAAAPEIVGLFAALVPLGYTCTSDTGLAYRGGWRLTIRRPEYPDQFAYPGEYVLITDASHTTDPNTGEVKWTVSPLTQVTVYGVSAGQPSVEDFIATYTADLPLIWDTSQPPVATPTPGLGASIVVPAPTSANGPFTWTLHRTDETKNTTSDLAVTPTITNGQVTLTDSGLTAGDVYGWTVTLATQYPGVQAVSGPSDTITATD